MIDNEKVKKFRQKYISEISRFYSPFFHLFSMWATASAVVVYCLLEIESAGLYWLLLVPIFVFLNFVEWAAHKYVMHKKINLPGLRDLYERHTFDHHQYFIESEMTFGGWKEMRVIAFPWQAMVTFLLVGTLAGLIATFLFNANAGYVTLLGFMVYYLLFDIMHISCHFEDNFLLRNLPFINTIRRHHAAHHQKSKMTKINMNLTFPLADYLMNSSDLKRGFWGTMFNGYSEEHVDPKFTGEKQ